MPITPEEYESKDGLALAELVKSGEVTATELLDCALAISARENPRINAIVIDMEKEARAAIEAGVPKGPFEGVPFLLKDLALGYAGVRTTNGCRFYEDNVADHDSELVRRYKAAGLVTFGKSASPEFGLTTSTESILYGQTRNPWNLDHTAGGSSGGAAAAVAAGILPVANASDGGGSIRVPASCCGLFGMKPSRGRLPFGPDAGEGWSGMSTIHAVSRSVRDSAALMDATDGEDVGAPYAAPPKARDFVEEIGRPTGSLRIGVLRETTNGLPTHDDCRAALDDTLGLLRELGHTTQDVKLDVDSAAMGSASQAIMGGCTRATLEERAAVLGREFTADDLEPFTFAFVKAVQDRSATDYAHSVRTIHKVGREVERKLREVDFLVSPTMAIPPAKLGVLALTNPDHAAFGTAVLSSVGYTQVFNASGHPAMSVPLCWNDAGLPIGIQFVGRFGDEGGLYRLAGALEQARPWWDRRPGR